MIILTIQNDGNVMSPIIKPVRWTELSGLRTRVMDGLLACQLEVSGQRGVSVCLFKSRKKIRIYDMEGEEEEEDEDETFESSGLSSSQL